MRKDSSERSGKDFGVSADWSKGMMGAPFSAEHYSGRAVGDYSETFFGK